MSLPDWKDNRPDDHPGSPCYVLPSMMCWHDECRSRYVELVASDPFLLRCHTAKLRRDAA